MAGDLGTPLIGRIATEPVPSDGLRRRPPAPALVRAHGRCPCARPPGNGADGDDPVARVVAAELEARVEEIIAQEVGKHPPERSNATVVSQALRAKAGEGFVSPALVRGGGGPPPAGAARE